MPKAWADTVQALLAASFDVSSKTTDHGSTLDSARESFVIEVLRRFLPGNVHVGRGQAVGRNKRLSDQLDVVIYRQDMPLLPSGADSNLYFSEGVIATMEVKSRLNGSELKKACKNCLSVKRLHVNSRGLESHRLSREIPATYVLGYRGVSAATCVKKLGRWNRKARLTEVHELPDLIVTNRMVVLKNDYALVDFNLFKDRGKVQPPLYLMTEDRSPLRWVLLHLLQKIWRSHSASPVEDKLLGRIVEELERLANEGDRWGEWDSATGEILKLGDEPIAE